MDSNHGVVGFKDLDDEWSAIIGEKVSLFMFSKLGKKINET